MKVISLVITVCVSGGGWGASHGICAIHVEVTGPCLGVSSLLPPRVPGMEHRLSGLCGKGSYPLSHFTGLKHILRKEFGFGELTSSTQSKLRMDAFLGRNDERKRGVSLPLWKPHSPPASLTSAGLF